MIENTDKKYESINACRICKSENLETILCLGEHPLANSLKEKPDAFEAKFPLTILFCNNCSLVQLKEAVDKEVLFNHYVWVTGTSSTARNYAKTFFSNIVNIAEIKEDDFVVEIASNDGTFLTPFLDSGYHNVLGIEPATNIADMANHKGVKTLNGFWNEKTASELTTQYGNAQVIIARNVIPHVSELLNVIEGIKYCLKENGVGVIEFHYAGKILKELQYDSIYHEHLCYFSIKSISYLLESSGLFPFHVEMGPISGGSCVIYFSKEEHRKSKILLELMENEQVSGVNEISTWHSFTERCLQHKTKSEKIISSFSGKTVIGFGASARSSTYLNFCRFNSHIRAIIDNNPLKQGLYTPGSSIPVVSFKQGLDMKPDIILVFAWNFLGEIIGECRSNGYIGRFITPFPENPEILNN